MPVFIIAARCVTSRRYIGWGYGEPQRFGTYEEAWRTKEQLQAIEEDRGKLRRFDDFVIVQI